MKVLASLLFLGTVGLGSAPNTQLPLSRPSGRAEIGDPHSHAKGEDGLKDLAPGSSQSSVGPEEAVRNFYRWYLRALYQSPTADPFKEHKTEVEDYVTARLLQKLANSRRTSTVRKGPDVDTEYFFQTLDLDSDWEKNISVSEPTMKGVTAVSHVTLIGRGDSRQDLRVVLKQESGLWKIDDVGLWRQ